MSLGWQPWWEFRLVRHVPRTAFDPPERGRRDVESSHGAAPISPADVREVSIRTPDRAGLLRHPRSHCGSRSEGVCHLGTGTGSSGNAVSPTSFRPSSTSSTGSRCSSACRVRPTGVDTVARFRPTSTPAGPSARRFPWHPEPGRELLDRPTSCRPVARFRRLGIDRVHAKHARLPVVELVGPPDQSVAAEDREDEVSELALRLRHVDLQAEPEVEQSLGALRDPRSDRRRAKAASCGHGTSCPADRGARPTDPADPRPQIGTIRPSRRCRRIGDPASGPARRRACRSVPAVPDRALAAAGRRGSASDRDAGRAGTRGRDRDARSQIRCWTVTADDHHPALQPQDVEQHGYVLGLHRSNRPSATPRQPGSPGRAPGADPRRRSSPITYRTNASFASSHRRTYSRRFQVPWGSAASRCGGSGGRPSARCAPSTEQRALAPEQPFELGDAEPPAEPAERGRVVRPGDRRGGSICTSPRRRTTSSDRPGRERRELTRHGELPRPPSRDVDRLESSASIEAGGYRPTPTGSGEPFCLLVRTPTEYRAEVKIDDPGSDAALMAEFAAREERAAGTLFDRFASRIYGLGVVMLGNPRRPRIWCRTPS